MGMKMHIGVDELLGLIHSLETTPANEHGLNVAAKLLHGQEARVWADTGYTDVQNQENLVLDNCAWFVAMRLGQRKKLAVSKRRSISRSALKPMLDMLLSTSNACSAIARLAIVAWRRATRGPLPPLGECLFAGFSQVELAPKLAPSHPKH